MSQAVLSKSASALQDSQWVLKEKLRLERDRQKLLDMKAEMQELKKDLQEKEIQLDKKITEYEAKKILDEKNREHERLLFETKFKVLETELKKLAYEKDKLEKEKAFYKAVNDFRETETVTSGCFFKGVDSDKALKKRYKELMKIYHPDNPNGDSEIVSMINAEYEELRDRKSVV